MTAGPDAGPRVVAIGGGHGLAATLLAARTYAAQITAVVSVADDGGSTGRLRADLGIPAPGDLRRCLAALAAPSSALGAALEYRFPSGELAGHPLGNLLIAGLAGAGADFLTAVDEVASLVGAAGRVLPAAVEPVVLVAEPWRQGEGSVGGAEGASGGSGAGGVEGQVAVQHTSGLRRVALRPAAPASPSAVAEAIGHADQVIVGPGSLFTSVLAAALVPAVRDALVATPAQRVHVANLAPEVPETQGLTVADHLSALAGHGVPVDVVLCDPATPGGDQDLALPTLTCALAGPDGRSHDPAALGAALAGLAAQGRPRHR